MKTTKTKNKQLVHKKTITSYIPLPSKLVNAINTLDLSQTYKSHCFKFIGLLLRDSLDINGDLISFSPKPQEYLKLAFDNYYSKWLHKLLNKEIIIRSENYSEIEGICYYYKINPIFFSEDITSTTLCNQKSYKPLISVGYKDIIKNITKDNNEYYNWFIKDMESLSINYDKLEEILATKLKTITIDNFEIDEQIKDKSIFLCENGLTSKGFYIKTENAIQMANSKGMHLIKDEDKYKIDFIENFIKKKKEAIEFSYQNSILRLKNKNYVGSRNKTNNRLDTNITNLSSLLVDEICLQNFLIQIDLSNSQFVILANHLKDKLFSDDYYLFKKLSIQGNLYSYIKEKLSLKTIEEAKNAMFEILFSSHNNRTSNKAKLKRLFPTVVKWIDDYKSKFEYQNFSILLQKIESDLFIDKILKRVKKQKFFCLTKHDSLIIRKEDYETILAITENEFESIGMEYTLKITNQLGNGETSKIYSKNNSVQSTSLEIEEEITVDIKTLTLAEIQNKGYSTLEFRNTHGNSFKIPKVFVRYWEKIRARKGTIANLSQTYSQNSFELELKKSIENMITNEMILKSFA